MNKEEQQDLRKILKEIAWLQSEALIDSPNYFVVPIDKWEELKTVKTETNRIPEINAPI